MAYKNISMDFFQLNTEANITVHDMLQVIQQLPVHDRHRRLTATAEPISMNELDFVNGLWQGTITKIRMNQLPVRANLDGSVNDIILADNEGIGEQVSFVYDPTPHIRTLVIQRNLYGIKAPGLCDYISLITTQREIVPSPILSVDAMQRMANKRIVKKLEIKFAAPNNPDVFTQGNHSLEGLTNVLSDLNAGNISVTLSTDRGETMDFRRVRTAINTLMTNPDEVERLRLVGQDDEDSPKEQIDLLYDRMVEEVRLDIDRNHPLRPVAMYGNLRTAHATRRNQLDQMFRAQMR